MNFYFYFNVGHYLSCYCILNWSDDVICFAEWIIIAEGVRDKMLLAARKIRRATCTDFVISLVVDDFSRISHNYMGKLK